MPYVSAQEGGRVHYERRGEGQPSLVFVHGWLGTSAWWSAQEAFFADRFTVLRMDLPGHGKSSGFSGAWSSRRYADSIKAVIDDAGVPEVVLVGHSMAGAFTLEASLTSPQVRAVVLVDTLKNLDALMSYEQAERMLFSLYRADFRAAVESVLPAYLFAPTTPGEVKRRLQEEFLAVEPERAVELIKPLYKMDVRNVAQRVGVPVRAINSDFTPTNVEANRKVFSNYGLTEISGTGHYPMLEKPDAFNRALSDTLDSLALRRKA